MNVDDLRRTAAMVINQVGHWTPERWRDRGQGLHETLQHLVDLQGLPYRVPRLGDLALPDQLRVVVDEFIASAPTATQVESAVEALNEARRRLS